MLFNSAILETAIGLFLLYLLIALIASAVNEALAALFSRRARTLREGIAHLLDDPILQGLAGRFYQQRIILGANAPQGTAAPPESPLLPAPPATVRGPRRLVAFFSDLFAGKGKPSYIASADFVHALLAILPIEDGGPGAQTPAETYVRLRDELASPTYAASPLARLLVELFDAGGLDAAHVRSLAATARQLACVRTEFGAVIARHTQAGADPTILQPVLRQLAEIDALATATETQLAAAAHNVQQSLARYFDDTMQRVSGWYKRRTQLILVAIVGIFTVLLNADTLAVGSALSADAHLRRGIVAAAATEVAGGGVPAAQPDLVESLDLFGAVLTWHTLPAGAAAAAQKALGLLITAIAASLGAPFWFDVLNKAVNLRLTGSAPAPRRGATTRPRPAGIL
jgi:hypothetical protein